MVLNALAYLLASSKGWNLILQPDCQQHQRDATGRNSLPFVSVKAVISWCAAYLLVASKGATLDASAYLGGTEYFSLLVGGIKGVVLGASSCLNRAFQDASTHLSAASKGWYWTGQNRSRASAWCTYILHRKTTETYFIVPWWTVESRHTLSSLYQF